MPYGAPLEAEGGTWDYHWSMASGSLPDGLFLHGNGVIDETPTAEGTFNFTFQVTDSSVPTPQIDTQSLSITIAPSPGMPDINVKQNTTDIPDGTGSYDYGSHDINTNTDVIFTIENTDTGELSLYGIQITGTNADQFSITQQPSSPVAPGGNTILAVNFHPTSANAKTALLTIENNDPDDEGQHDITLNGTGSAPVYPSGIVAYWKFDEGSGTTAYDSINYNNGTVKLPVASHGAFCKGFL
jgi:archaellin